MSYRLNNILLSLILVSSASVTKAWSQQNPQSFLNNVENNINNNVNPLNPNQAAQLDQRANAIQQQELRDMAKNNGTLTPQQQARLDREVGNLNRSTNYTQRMDNSGVPNPNGIPPYPQPGYYNGQPNPYWHQQQQQWLQSHPNAVPQQYNQNDNPYHHHHRYINPMTGQPQ